MMQIVGSFADFERAMFRERTRVGLETALNAHQQQEVLHLVHSGQVRKPRADDRQNIQRPPCYCLPSFTPHQRALTEFYVPLLPKPLNTTFG